MSWSWIHLFEKIESLLFPACCTKRILILRKSRNSCLLMDHSRGINTAVWAEDILHSCATGFSIFGPLLWIIKCGCESKHQAITLPLPTWRVTLWSILVIHVFRTMCNAVLYRVKWIQKKHGLGLLFSLIIRRTCEDGNVSFKWGTPDSAGSIFY